MSSITSAVSGLLTSVGFHGHGHKRGATSSSSSSSATTSSNIGQLPVSVSTALFGGLVQAFQQSIGSQSTSAVSGAAAPTPSAGTAASAAAAPTPAQGQDLHAFQHSLVQALKQDGLTANNPGSVVSSLQDLIQQLGPNGKPTAATETLTSTFQNLVNNYTANHGGTSSGGSSNTGLLTFLNNLVQKVQTTGSLTVASMGSNVNAQV